MPVIFFYTVDIKVFP